MRRLLIVVATVPFVLLSTGCGVESPPVAAQSPEVQPIRLVDAVDAAAILADAPEDLVVLDVRTPEEFAEGHLEGATLLDFYEPSFSDDLAALDRDVRYVIYCRSGNRSGQAAEIMRELGFTEVTDVDGGIQAWSAAGLPLAG